MSDMKIDRREMIAAAAFGLSALPLVALTAGPASAEQGNMDRAMGALNNALDALRRATPNKGGHKERAVELIRQAMSEVQAGIDYAAAHGGG